MDEKKHDLFYIAVAIYLDLDSVEVDEILANVGLSVKDNSVEECKQAILKHRAIYVACHLARQLQPTIS